MKSRIFALGLLGVLLLNIAGPVLADTRGTAVKKSPANQLALLLPASDAIVTLDVKRFFGVALPRLLSANQTVLADILGKVDEMKATTGIDIRQFEYLAAGVTAKKTGEKQYDLEPVVIIRGQVNAGGLLGAAKLAANGKYREERAGEKTIYVFAAKDIAAQAKQQVPGGKTGMADRIIGKLSEEVAVSTIDANTLVLGSLPRVRQALSGKSTVGSDLTGMLGKGETSVVSFAAKLPAGMKSFLPIDNDELGKNIEAIRYIYGNVDMTADSLSVDMTARTLQNAQASALLDTLQGLQMVGKALLGGSKAPDKQIYARLVEKANFSVKGNEVMLDLQVPQTDIDVLVGMIK